MQVFWQLEHAIFKRMTAVFIQVVLLIEKQTT